MVTNSCDLHPSSLLREGMYPEFNRYQSNITFPHHSACSYINFVHFYFNLFLSSTQFICLLQIYFYISSEFTKIHTPHPHHMFVDSRKSTYYFRPVIKNCLNYYNVIVAHEGCSIKRYEGWVVHKCLMSSTHNFYSLDPPPPHTHNKKILTLHSMLSCSCSFVERHC